ncbi:MAG: hypothetical protein ACTMH5_15810, partial [Brachybacterium sp.]
MPLEMTIRVWNALLKPTVRSTKPNPDEQIPVALAARIADIDRSSLAHLVDHGLITGSSRFMVNDPAVAGIHAT